MAVRKEPISRRERPPKPALSRRGIVAAAVRVMRSEGTVTMRRLAQELDTGPASLYVYVADTADLYAAILDALMGEVDLAPEDAGVGWRDQLVAVLIGYTRVLMEHPQLARSAVVARPNGENFLGLVERMLSLLSRSGAAREQIAWGVDYLLQYATATAAEHGTQSRSPGIEDEWDALARNVEEVDDATHPMIKAHMPALLAGTAEDRLIWGFHVLITGITQTPVPGAPH